MALTLWGAGGSSLEALHPSGNRHTANEWAQEGMPGQPWLWRLGAQGNYAVIASGPDQWGRTNGMGVSCSAPLGCVSAPGLRPLESQGLACPIKTPHRAFPATSPWPHYSLVGWVGKLRLRGRLSRVHV